MIDRSAHRIPSLSLLRASIPLAPDARVIRDWLTSSDLDWDDLVYLADGHAIAPLLYKTWRALDLISLIPERAHAYFGQAHRDNQTRNAQARSELMEIWNLLTTSNLPPIVLKGLPLIDSLYDDPALRFLNDADFLLDTLEHALVGLELLLACGFEPVPTKAHVFNTKHLPSVWRLNGFQRRGYLFDPARPRPVELHVTL